MEEKCKNYSYAHIKNDLDNISNEIGQIRLFSDTQISNTLRDDLNIQPQTKIIPIKNNNENVNNEFQQETTKKKN